MNAANQTDYSEASGDVSEPEMHSDAFRLSTFLLETVAIGVVCTFGILGNVLSVIVLRFDKTSTATSFLLQALACGDVLLLLVSMVYLCPRGFFLYFQHHTLSDPYFQEFYWRSVPYLWSAGMVAQTCVNWLVVLVTLERYIVVCWPLNAPRLCTARNAKMAASAASLAAVLYNLPRPFEWESRPAQLFATCAAFEEPNGTQPQDAIVEGFEYNATEVLLLTHDSVLRRLPLYNYVYRMAMYALCVALGPLAVLLAVNVKLIAALRQADERRARMSPHGPHGPHRALHIYKKLPDIVVQVVQPGVPARLRRTEQYSRGRANLFVNQRTYTRLVVILVATFIVCQTPAMFHQVLVALGFDGSDSAAECGSDHQAGGNAMVYSSYASNLLVVLNCSANFLLYCAYGKKFRTLVKRLLTRSSAKQKHTSLRWTVSNSLLTTPSKSPAACVNANANASSQPNQRLTDVAEKPSVAVV